MINRSADGKQRVLSLSYGKDSLACLGAIELLGLPLDRIVHAEVWATDTIPADLPPMVEFKAKANKIIKERWGFEVEHYSAGKTYNDCFYQVGKGRSEKHSGKIYGFPYKPGQWCNSRLKMGAMYKANSCSKGTIRYIGIAADEPNRFHNLDGVSKISPLVEIGWTESAAKQWCIYNDLLSPIYTDSARGGCWFCHNQSIGQLRLLRRNYPELWEMMLAWDLDSPNSFKADGRTVHDFDRRFQLEDEGLIDELRPFKWSMLDEELNYNLFAMKED